MQTLQLRRAYLRVVEGPDKGLEKPVPPHGLVVGKNTDCSFILCDPTVSGRHFEITPSRRGFCITDLESRNGTWVRDLNLREAQLRANEVIRIGRTVLRLVIMEGVDGYPLSPHSSFGPMFGDSVAMRHTFAVLERAALNDSALLIEGDPGTGKTLAANAVHMCSPRGDKPLVILDCANSTPIDIERELFGISKRTFPRVVSEIPGALERAKGGTLVLDEVSFLDSVLQTKLARLVESKEFTPLGGAETKSLETRIIATSTKDLESETQSGHFRRDLFYLLSVIRVRLPKLKDRQEDLVPLAERFVLELDKPTDPRNVLSQDVTTLLKSHKWPGNVTELRRIIEKLALSKSEPASIVIEARRKSDAADLIDFPFHRARKQWTDRFEREYLAAMLNACRGIVTHAAERAGIPRQTFHRLMNKHRISKPASSAP